MGRKHSTMSHVDPPASGMLVSIGASAIDAPSCGGVPASVGSGIGLLPHPQAPMTASQGNRKCMRCEVYTDARPALRDLS